MLCDSAAAGIEPARLNQSYSYFVGSVARSEVRVMRARQCTVTWISKRGILGNLTDAVFYN